MPTPGRSSSATADQRMDNHLRRAPCPCPHPTHPRMWLTRAARARARGKSARRRAVQHEARAARRRGGGKTSSGAGAGAAPLIAALAPPSVPARRSFADRVRGPPPLQGPAVRGRVQGDGRDPDRDDQLVDGPRQQRQGRGGTSSTSGSRAAAQGARAGRRGRRRRARRLPSAPAELSAPAARAAGQGLNAAGVLDASVATCTARPTARSSCRPRRAEPRVPAARAARVPPAGCRRQLCRRRRNRPRTLRATTPPRGAFGVADVEALFAEGLAPPADGGAADGGAADRARAGASAV